MPHDAALASLNPAQPHSAQDLVDHLVQACDEQDVLYVVFWLRKMKDKGLLWSVGGKDGVDAPHTWKGVSALQLVSTSPYTPLRDFILELLLLNIEQPRLASDVTRRVVDSRGQSAVKARELLALNEDGSAASWIDANLPLCPTPDDQLTGFKALPPPPSAVPIANGLPQPLADDTRTPSTPLLLALPVVKVVPPTPQAAVRVANVLDGQGPQPPPITHEDSTQPARPSSAGPDVLLRVATPSDRARPVEEGEIRLTFSSDFEATHAEHSRQPKPVADEVPLDIDLEASLLPSLASRPVERFSLPPAAPSLATPNPPARPLAGPVRLYLTNLPLDATGSKLRNFLSAKLGVQHLTQPRLLPDGATGFKQAWVTIADREVAARAAQLAKDKVVEWNGLLVAARVISTSDGPQKSVKSFRYASKRAESEPAAVEPKLKQEPAEADFARSHPVWHSASHELERKPRLPDRKILLNPESDESPKVKYEDEDVKMAEDEEEAKPSPPQDLPFSLPFLASTSAAPAIVHSPSYASPSPTPPPSHFVAGYKGPENPYRSRSPVDRSRPYRSPPPPPHRLSPILGPSKLSQEFLKDEEGVAPRPTHSSPYPSPELSPPPALRPLPAATKSSTLPWATSPVSPELAADEVEANPFAALFASSISPTAPSNASSPAPPTPLAKPALRSSLKRSAPSVFSGEGSRDSKRRRTVKSVHWAKEIAVVVGHGAGHVAEVEEAGDKAVKQPGGWSEKRVGAGLRW